MFLPLYSLSTTLDNETQALKNDLTAVQKQLTLVPTALPEVGKVLTPLAQANAQINQISTVYPTVLAPRPNWSAVMSAIGNYDQNQITLVALARNENRVTVTGQAVNDAAAVAYARTLETSPLFSRVILQSIQMVATPVLTPTATITPTVTRTATASIVTVPTYVPPPTSTRIPVAPTTISVPTVALPPTATPTSTPDPRDQYEPDDSTPSVIVFNQPQLHNFYPNGDIDTATFLAKGGHYYRVYTADLSPGVDTLMTVQIGDTILDNDDSKTGALNSELIIQNTGFDTMAIITVRNRGQSGGDKWYKLFVEEVVIAPTNTPSPTPTLTRTPTATIVPPTNTPTATPDLRDAFEPDDATPRAIAVGEMQTHNFYPTGDIDKVSFPVKNGRFYQVLTSDLALGVDTALTINLGSNQWTNDDYAPGSGNYASAVCFQATQDGNAVATIINSARMYAPDKTYKIRVTEVSNLNAAPCVPAPTPAAQNQIDVNARVHSIAWFTTQTDAPASVQLPASAVRFVIVLELKAALP
jgi:hypothetical protein